MSRAFPKPSAILCVDDDDQLRASLALNLRSNGYEVVESNSADDAAEIIRKRNGRFQALISDFSMPGRSGSELIVQVDQHFPKVDVYILMSGHPKTDPGIEELLAKTTTVPLFFLSKPFEFGELTALLEKAKL